MPAPWLNRPDDYNSDPWCIDCGLDIFRPDGSQHPDIRWIEHHIVHDYLWAAAGMHRLGGYLCVRCLEGRLGRRLTPGDLTDCEANDPGPSDPLRLGLLKLVAQHRRHGGR